MGEVVAAIIGVIGGVLAALIGPLAPRLWKRRRKASLPTASPSSPSPSSFKGVGELRTLESREEAYRLAAETIHRVNREQTGPKNLLLAALHGHSGDRIDSRRATTPEFREFDSAFFQCVRSVGPDFWRVRELYNITSEERLSEICETLRVTANEDGYEVRAFCVPEAIPHLAPLVVGRCDAFLGTEDPRYYRVQGAVHLRGVEVVTLIAAYFESLWSHPRVFVLRTAVAVDEDAIERLRERIRFLQAQRRRSGSG